MSSWRLIWPIGVHVVDLPTTGLSAGACVALTFHWPDGNRWEGVNFKIPVE